MHGRNEKSIQHFNVETCHSKKLLLLKCVLVRVKFMFIAAYINKNGDAIFIIEL
jgi:hypothetical protein